MQKNIKFISLGGWCGTRISLREHHLYNESYPFDSIRSKFEGIIDCINTNFKNFFPIKIEPENFPVFKTILYRGKYFSFFHHNLFDGKIITDLKRRCIRFKYLLKKNDDKIIFIRTIITYDFYDEIKLTDDFIKSIKNINPDLNFILVFVITGQKTTQYYKNINDITFIFTLNDKIDGNLKDEYEPIFNFLLTNNLFENIPQSNDNIDIINGFSKFMDMDGINVFRDDN